ncbi:hypothetical protein [Pseudoalteromonas tunicata]|jgi:hypothetical protein|uniref:hypothetical protein n=1 Tax=Pseudoalteromonas tunicata TaxID=314281 RepID=UPI000BBFF71F|nr:hypothetical protein [Pseudoalteromonas tunicata]ATC94246.1 hypothetical protein PTUN_a1643 [Pseudoalteromonas tunicata]
MDSTTQVQLQWCRPKPKESIQNEAYNNFSRFSQECYSSLGDILLLSSSSTVFAQTDLTPLLLGDWCLNT